MYGECVARGGGTLWSGMRGWLEWSRIWSLASDMLQWSDRTCLHYWCLDTPCCQDDYLMTSTPSSVAVSTPTLDYSTTHGTSWWQVYPLCFPLGRFILSHLAGLCWAGQLWHFNESLTPHMHGQAGILV